MSLLQRLKKLEDSGTKAKQLKMLFQKRGESREACINRHGYAPDDKNAIYVMVTWLDVAI